MKHWLVCAFVTISLAAPVTSLCAQTAAEADAIPGTAQTAGLAARIVITGLNLLPIDASGEAAEQNQHNWVARVIDPTESVDKVLPSGPTTLSYSSKLGYPERIIAVQFNVPVDLAGGEAGFTPVDVMIPVELDSSGEAQLDAEIALSQLPDSQWVVELDYRLQCGGKQQRERCRLYWRSRKLVYDRDGDGVYEKVSGISDPDRNCLGGRQRWRHGRSDGQDQGGGRGPGGGQGNGQGRRQGGGNGGGGRHGDE